MRNTKAMQKNNRKNRETWEKLQIAYRQAAKTAKQILNT